MVTSRIVPLALVALVAGAPFSFADSSSSRGKRIDVPPVPTEIQVPAGHAVYLKGFAVGTQNYVCAITKTDTFDWLFIGPQATLFTTAHGEPVRQNMTHYLSQNVDEVETLRATWMDSEDSSRVWAMAVASSQHPAYVAADAIPWLLLDVVGDAPGPTGGRTLTRTSLIQRLNTTGGRKPSTGCTLADQIGTMRFVPYTAEYYFYRARW